MSPLADAAVALAERGFAVFPLQVREKKPLGRTTGLHAGSADPALARARWAGLEALPLKPAEPGREVTWCEVPVRASPRCNVGVATGSASGVWVLDEDGAEGAASMAALEAQHGALPETVEQRTGNGRHRLFAWDPERTVRNSAGKVGAHVDVRGEGGYIVAPPSVHPSGRVYAWAPGRAPGEIAVAAAPAWLLNLVAPILPEAPAAPVRRPPSGPGGAAVREGRASAFGEATLATSCRIVAQAAPGTQSDKLFGYAMFVGGYVAGGEIDREYARRELVEAGKRMQAAGKPWSLKEIEGHVERGLAKGAELPRSAPALEGPRSAAASAARSASPDVAVERRGVQRAWGEAGHAMGGALVRWLTTRGLDPDGLPGARGKLRVAQGADGPTLLAPLVDDLDAVEPEALWRLPLLSLAERFPRNIKCDPECDEGANDFCLCAARSRESLRVVGDTEGRVCVLSRPAEPHGVLVALDLADAWALGSAAAAEGWPCLVAWAPRLSTFAGGPLGDRFGRVDPETPLADPARRPWLLPEDRINAFGPVHLAVRGDLRSPPLRVRRAMGGTRELRLEGEAAARFYAGLAEQHWRDLGANAVRALRPTAGRMGFCEGVRR